MICKSSPSSNGDAMPSDIPISETLLIENFPLWGSSLVSRLGLFVLLLLLFIIDDNISRESYSKSFLIFSSFRKTYAALLFEFMSDSLSENSCKLFLLPLFTTKLFLNWLPKVLMLPAGIVFRCWCWVYFLNGLCPDLFITPFSPV